MSDFNAAAPAPSIEGAYFQAMEMFHSRCGAGQFIYRGQPKEFDEDNGRLTSSLYRLAREVIGDERLISTISLAGLEDYLVGKASQYFAGTSTLIEIYTLLRHFKAPLLLIDFSYDLNIALFFACNGHPADPGVVFVHQGADEPMKDIPADRSLCCEILPAYLSDSRSRVQSQKSAFIYAPDGYLEAGDDESAPCFKIKIAPALKPGILKYLEHYHQITYQTAYNDVFGFAENAPVAEWIGLRVSQICLDQGMRAQGNKYLETIENNDVMLRERERTENRRPGSYRAVKKAGHGGSQLAPDSPKWARMDEAEEDTRS